MYDTIRDAVLTCAQKPTRVSLTYRTEPTTEKYKKTDMLRSIGKQSRGIRGVSPEEEKEGYGGKRLQKMKVLSLLLLLLLLATEPRVECTCRPRFRTLSFRICQFPVTHWQFAVSADCPREWRLTDSSRRVHPRYLLENIRGSVA